MFFVFYNNEVSSGSRQQAGQVVAYAPLLTFNLQLIINYIA